MNQLFTFIIAAAAGVVLGLAFGALQEAAARRNQRLQEEKKLKSGWAVMPGSFRRVGYLLIALVGVQVLCPFLFASQGPWFVSGGVVLGYGLVLYRQLMRVKAELAS